MMKVIKNLAFAFMVMLTASVSAQDNKTLEVGDYSGAKDNTDTYDGSYFNVAPTTYYLKHTGSQIIYTAEELKDMAGKEIKSINYVFYNLSCFSEINRSIKLYLKEVDANTFPIDNDGAYNFLEFDTNTTYADLADTQSMLDYYCDNGYVKVKLNKGFVYSGKKNLLVTITFDGEETTDGTLDAPFYRMDNWKERRALTFTSDKNTFLDYVESEDFPKATATLGCGNEIEVPVTQFEYAGDATTGIKTVTVGGLHNQNCYDLSGKKIEKKAAKNGIYIQNGKKYIVK